MAVCPLSAIRASYRAFTYKELATRNASKTEEEKKRRSAISTRCGLQRASRRRRGAATPPPPLLQLRRLILYPLPSYLPYLKLLSQNHYTGSVLRPFENHETISRGTNGRRQTKSKKEKGHQHRGAQHLPRRQASIARYLPAQIHSFSTYLIIHHTNIIPTYTYNKHKHGSARFRLQL